MTIACASEETVVFNGKDEQSVRGDDFSEVENEQEISLVTSTATQLESKSDDIRLMLTRNICKFIYFDTRHQFVHRCGFCRCGR
jgi:hypothetical protein